MKAPVIDDPTAHHAATAHPRETVHVVNIVPIRPAHPTKRQEKKKATPNRTPPFDLSC